jgi:hypothetical protein
LVGTLRSRELDAIGQRLASETGLAHLPAETGERVEGTYSGGYRLRPVVSR